MRMILSLSFLAVLAANMAYGASKLNGDLYGSVKCTEKLNEDIPPLTISIFKETTDGKTSYQAHLKSHESRTREQTYLTFSEITNGDTQKTTLVPEQRTRVINCDVPPMLLTIDALESDANIVFSKKAQIGPCSTKPIFLILNHKHGDDKVEVYGDAKNLQCFWFNAQDAKTK